MAHPAPRPVAGAKLFLLTLAWSLSWASGGDAASPSLGGVRPFGGRRGTEMTLSLVGARLADAREVLFYDPGITVSKLDAVNDGQVKALVKIAPDCPLGE